MPPVRVRRPPWPPYSTNSTAPRRFHIVTLEDPIEFVHKHHLSTFNQRELGSDFDTYPNGLRSALRQAPKVILVGEMRDRQTVEIALTAAETGHLVLEYPAHHRRRAIHQSYPGSFRSGRGKTGPPAPGRHVALRRQPASRAPDQWRSATALMEVMGNSLRTKETIALGEEEGGRNFYDIIEASETFGWFTFDQSILHAYEDGLIEEDTAMLYASKKGQNQPRHRPRQKKPWRRKKQGQRLASGYAGGRALLKPATRRQAFFAKKSHRSKRIFYSGENVPSQAVARVIYKL